MVKAIAVLGLAAADWPVRNWEPRGEPEFPKILHSTNPPWTSASAGFRLVCFMDADIVLHCGFRGGDRQHLLQPVFGQRVDVRGVRVQSRL